MGEDPQLPVDRCPDLGSISAVGKKLRQVLAEMVEHRADETVLASEVPMNQAVIDTRALRDVADGGGRRTAFGKQIGGGLQNRGNDFIPAQRDRAAR